MPEVTALVSHVEVSRHVEPPGMTVSRSQRRCTLWQNGGVWLQAHDGEIMGYIAAGQSFPHPAVPSNVGNLSVKHDTSEHGSEHELSYLPSGQSDCFFTDS